MNLEEAKNLEVGDLINKPQGQENSIERMDMARKKYGYIATLFDCLRVIKKEERGVITEHGYQITDGSFGRNGHQNLKEWNDLSEYRRYGSNRNGL
jgi:hypothetical protein